MPQTVTVRAGADGKVTLALGEAYANKLVQVTVQEVPSDTSQEERVRFIESMAGKIDDPTFVRHPQGDYEQRDEL